MSNVEIVRLTSGEEVIASVEEKGDTIVLNKPLLLIPLQEGKLTFATWLPYNDDDFIVVGTKYVIFKIKPVPEMVKQYQQITGQIITSQNKIIL